MDQVDCQDRAAWRSWLEVHHKTASQAWLVLHKRSARRRSLSLEEAVEEALCFGWIDGKLRSLDSERYVLRFSPRRTDSVWSMSNIRRVEELTRQGLMTEAGLQKVAEGRKSGQWDAAIRREQVDLIPSDLARALRKHKGATARYRALPAPRRKQMLHWLMTARSSKTRQRRVGAIVEEIVG